MTEHECNANTALYFIHVAFFSLQPIRNIEEDKQQFDDDWSVRLENAGNNFTC